MICPKCGAEVPEGMFFCGACGEPMAEAEHVEKVEAEVVENAAPGNSGAQSDACTPPRREAPAAGNGSIDSSPYLIFAILATLFCFLPTGIPAIVYAAKIDSAELRGDHDSAADSAKKSKMWSIISACVAAASLVIVVIIWVLMVVGIVGIVAAAGAGSAIFH